MNTATGNLSKGRVSFGDRTRLHQQKGEGVILRISEQGREDGRRGTTHMERQRSLILRLKAMFNTARGPSSGEEKDNKKGKE